MLRVLSLDTLQNNPGLPPHHYTTEGSTAQVMSHDLRLLCQANPSRGPFGYCVLLESTV